MNLKTNIAIDYSAGIGSTGNGIVEGYLGGKALLEDGSWNVGYLYKVGDEIIGQGTIKIEASNVQAMYDAVKAGLPSIDTDFNGHLETAFYKAFINEMVTTFDGLTSSSQIDLVP